ncbi:hypothetical protein QQS21_002834 [Conoideocrella luteorostrata]|uniref:Uncharacterized protein n=1 Tax=Conoideocrella luteorostrata TaxID=1105319 RepID=A0AAJ0CXF4_9HYPO|nr:hypothetical protein QQS21_002834 [Conoideocrella luteorostrata]
MADTNVSAFSRVGIPGQDASRPHVGAPPPEGAPFLAVCPPAPAHMIERDAGKLSDRQADKPAEKPAEKPVDKPEPSVEEKKPNGDLDGFRHSFGDPKPVEVMSVPETPVNGSTPAGGTPRPELKIPEDPAPAPAEPTTEPVIEPVVMTGVQEPKPTSVTSAPEGTENKPPASLEPQKPVEESKPSIFGSLPAKESVPEPVVNGTMDIDKPEAPVTHTGPEALSVPAPAPAPVTAPVSAPAPMPKSPTPAKAPEPTTAVSDEPAAGEKRKLDEVAVPATTKPLTENQAAPDALPLDKKPKIDDTLAQSKPAPAADAVPVPTAAAEAEPPSSSPKASKSKKEKKQPVVGRTARKTRSQGPADV